MTTEQEQPDAFLGKTLDEWEAKGDETRAGEARVSGPDLSLDHFFYRQPLDQIKELDRHLYERVLAIKSDAEKRVNNIDRIRRAIRDSGVTPYKRGER